MSDFFKKITEELYNGNIENARTILNHSVMEELVSEAGANIAAVRDFLKNDKEAISQFLNAPNNMKALINNIDTFKNIFVDWLSEKTGVQAGFIYKRKDVIKVVNRMIDAFADSVGIESAYTQSTNNNPLNSRSKPSIDQEADINPSGAVTNLDRERFYGGGETGNEVVPGTPEDIDPSDEHDLKDYDSRKIKQAMSHGDNRPAWRRRQDITGSQKHRPERFPTQK